jgi:hypothetical protein
MREDSNGELWSPAESEPIAVLNCRRSRHNRPHHLRSPIRMTIRSRRPSWQIFCRRGGGRQNPSTAAQIAQKPQPAASHRWSLHLGECSQRAAAAHETTGEDLSASYCRHWCDGGSPIAMPPTARLR